MKRWIGAAAMARGWRSAGRLQPGAPPPRIRKLAYTQRTCTQWACTRLTQRRQSTSARGVESDTIGMMPTIRITALLTTTDLMIIGLTRMRRRCRSSSALGLGRGGNRRFLNICDHWRRDRSSRAARSRRRSWPLLIRQRGLMRPNTFVHHCGPRIHGAFTSLSLI